MTQKNKLKFLLESAIKEYERYLLENESPYLVYHCFLADYLIKNGVIVLPVKVGDTVFIKGHRHSAEIETIYINENGVIFEWVEYERSYDLTEVWDDGEFRLEDIGKTVFLSLEELEQAERREDEN